MVCAIHWQNLFINLMVTATPLSWVVSHFGIAIPSLFPQVPLCCLSLADSHRLPGRRVELPRLINQDSLCTSGHHAQSQRRIEKETAVPAGRRGPGCVRCWWSPGCPWLPRSSHSICARLGTAVPGQRESSVYSLFLRTLKRQRCTSSYITCRYTILHKMHY